MLNLYEAGRENDTEICCHRDENNWCCPHFHSNLEIVYVEQGAINMVVNGSTKTLTPGCLAVAGSYDIHSYTTDGYSQTLLLIVPLECTGGLVKTLRTKAFSSPFLSPGPESSEIHDVLQKLLHAREAYSHHVMTAYACAVLGILCCRLELTEKSDTSGMELSRRLLFYLHQHFTETVTLERLSREFGYHHDYLSRFFHSYLGIGFHSYLNTLRIRHASSLMQTSDLPLTEIAFRSGFCNYRTFNKVFRATCGMTPTGYLKQAEEKLS